MPRLVVDRTPRRTITDSNGNKVVFRAAMELECTELARGEWACQVPRLGVREKGFNCAAAMAAAADAIRAETDELLHTMSHTLDRGRLDRKGLLLGGVDIFASKIARSIGEFTWISGRVEKDVHGVAWFRESRIDGEVFPIDPSVPIPADTFTRMAKLRMDDVGDAIGPVIEFEEPLCTDPEATWAEWERLMSRDQ